MRTLRRALTAIHVPHILRLFVLGVLPFVAAGCSNGALNQALSVVEDKALSDHDALKKIAYACVYDKEARVTGGAKSYHVSVRIEAPSRTLGKTKEDAMSYARQTMTQRLLCLFRAGKKRNLSSATMAYYVKIDKDKQPLLLERVSLRTSDLESIKDWEAKPFIFLQDTTTRLAMKKKWKRLYSGWHRVRLTKGY